MITREKGLYRYNGDVLKYLEFSRNQRFTPTSFYIDDKDQLYISYFGKGIDIFDGSKVRRLNVRKGLASDYIRSISVNNDSYWYAGARGITIMNEGIYKSYTVNNGLPHNYCFHTYIDEQGRNWVGTEGGVAVFENGKVWSLTQDDGFLRVDIHILKMQYSSRLTHK